MIRGQVTLLGYFTEHCVVLVIIKVLRVAMADIRDPKILESVWLVDLEIKANIRHTNRV